MASVLVQFGGVTATPFTLETNSDLVVIRTQDKRPVEEARLSGSSRRLLDGLEPVTRFEEAGVEVFHVRSGSSTERDAVRTAFKKERDICFAGRVLSPQAYKPQSAIKAVEPAASTVKEPVIYSENLFVKFWPSLRPAAARKAIAARNLKVKRTVDYVENGYFVAAPDNIGLDVFELALSFLRSQDGVEFCHPELIRPRQFRRAFGPQWHLKRTRVGGVSIAAAANVVGAWKLSKGKGTTIAVIDTGIDIDHEEFASSGKIVAPRDATPGAQHPNDPRPRSLREEKHGTCCAGVACANGRKGASGVAPAAKLMPIRLMAGLGSQAEADAFAWATDHGADVISCSWGPNDGDWWDPSDPAHRSPVHLPDNTRLAIDYALTHGRGGKGCVICWAAGNGNESVDDDGYASHPGVIAVAACNDRGTRSVYSDTGSSIWCAFPSDDDELEAMATPNPAPHGGVWSVDHPPPQTPGIWTTDWSGAKGYNKGSIEMGDEKGNYTNSFGGTSSATPGVAGVAALVISKKKSLTQADVKDILKRSCDKIDSANGGYDAVTGHSPWYGYGRLNAVKAVKIATRRKRR